MTVRVGDYAPEFTVETTYGTLSLKEMLRDGALILVFYTQDATPTCTTQVCSFRDNANTLHDLGSQILGVSADDIDSHRIFTIEHGIPFPLAADADLELARKYDVLTDDGKRSRRAVFVIGENGRILSANDHYQPADATQFAQVFQALGLD